MRRSGRGIGGLIARIRANAPALTAMAAGYALFIWAVATFDPDPGRACVYACCGVAVGVGFGMIGGGSDDDRRLP